MATTSAAEGGARSLAGLTGWLRKRRPDLVPLRRAVRVTLAACAGFYVCRYLVGDATAALYALFGTIALGALSEVTGTPAQRTRTYAAALIVGLGITTIGTLLAVNTWAAACGMLVIGFAVAYAGVGGPRVAGVASGLQLFYMLPCFPPYAPHTLDERLVGLAVGVGLLAVADRVILPAPQPHDPATRIADAAAAVDRFASGVGAALREPAAADLGESDLRATALDAAARLRVAAIPLAERPLGPGVRQRCLLAAAGAVRMIAARLATLADEIRAGPGPRPHPAVARLVAGVEESLRRAGDALRGSGPAPSLAPLDDALATYLDGRAARLADHPPLHTLRAGIAAAAVAEAARSLVLATRGAVGAPAPEPDRTPPQFWFLHASPLRLWWRRLRGDLTPRSVYFQNAVRLALGLALARVVAGGLDLAHGFWALLATLVLMRTCTAAGRAALPPAFAGTVAGAAAGSAVLLLAGTTTTVYAVLLPFLMVAALAAGPLFGIAAGQAGFTLVVVLLFAQVGPADWRLAEVRLVDVVVGGLVGALIGAAVWPRGGGGEVRRAAAANLRAGADAIVATVGALVGGRPAPPEHLGHQVRLFEHAFAQYRTEPGGSDQDRDWFSVLAVAHRLENDVHVLLARHPPDGPLPWPERADRARRGATATAAGYRATAEAIARDEPPADEAAAVHGRLAGLGPPRAPAGDPDDVLRLLDTWGWLHDLANGLERVEHALTPDRR